MVYSNVYNFREQMNFFWNWQIVATISTSPKNESTVTCKSAVFCWYPWQPRYDVTTWTSIEDDSVFGKNLGGVCVLKMWVGQLLYVGRRGSGRGCPHWIWAFTGADEAPWKSLVCSQVGRERLPPHPHTCMINSHSTIVYSVFKSLVNAILSLRASLECS